MASEKKAAQRFAAVELEEGKENPLGTIEIDANGTITVPDASKRAKDDLLLDIVTQMNAKKVIHVDAPPPEGAPRYTKASIIIDRGHPKFIPALKDHLRTYYHVELRPQ